MTGAAREELSLRPIGRIRSTLATRKDAPRQGSEGAPDAWLELDSAFAPGLSRISAGDDILVITWLHRADREVLEVHPRDDRRRKSCAGGRAMTSLGR